MSNKIKIRAIALTTVERKFAVMLFGVKLAVAFGRDSGAKVGYGVSKIEGEIGSGGSRVNWFCYVKEGSIFELEVDAEAYAKNKNRIKNWGLVEIQDFSRTPARSQELQQIESNLE